MKLEVEALYSELTALRAQLDDEKGGEANADFDPDYLFTQLKMLEKSLQTDYMSKGEIDKMFKSSLCEPPPSKSEVGYNEALVDFNKRLATSLTHLNNTKLEKALFGEELAMYKEALMKSVKAWNRNSADDTNRGVREMREELEGFKKYMEGLDERLGGVEGAGAGFSAADLQLKLAASARTIEESIKLSLIDDVSRQVNDLTSKLSAKPTKEELQNMMEGFQEQLKELTDTTGYSSNRIQIIVEDMKHKLNEKPARDTVRALVEAKIKEAKNALRMPDDTLMLGVTSQARCLSCNQTFPHVHGEKAKPVPTKGLAPVSSTVPEHRTLNTSIIGSMRGGAQYPHGRSGALRPIGLGGKPGVPRSSLRESGGPPSQTAYSIGNVDTRRSSNNLSRGSSRGGQGGGANGETVKAAYRTGASGSAIRIG